MVTLKKGLQLEVDVSDIAFGGRGLVRVDGMALFVDGAVPGDRVAARVTRRKRSYAEARVVTLVRPSPDRVAAPCPYSGVCGGCKWQFLDYPRQLEYKRRHVGDALVHIGGLRDIPVHATLASEDRFGYRNKMEFSCAERRWLLPHELGRPDVDQGFALGLHVPGTFYKVLDIAACLLQPDLGNRLLGEVRDHIRASAAPVYGLRSHEGFWRFVMLRHSVAQDGWMVNLITARDDPREVRPLAERLRERYEGVIAVVNNITARKAAIAAGEVERHLAGDVALEERIGGLRFSVSANSFFQTNTRGAEQLYRVTRDYAGLTGTETVMDLYCGTGTIALFLADAAREVLGMELAASAVADARANCRRNAITNCRFVQGDIRDLLPQITTPPQVMIIDPPRAGLHPDVVARVKTLAPPRIVYVSCNPATLARDLALLNETYRIAEVQPVDMFPHTYHIESVARLVRR